MLPYCSCPRGTSGKHGACLDCSTDALKTFVSVQNLSDVYLHSCLLMTFCPSVLSAQNVQCPCVCCLWSAETFGHTKCTLCSQIHHWGRIPSFFAVEWFHPPNIYDVYMTFYSSLWDGKNYKDKQKYFSINFLFNCWFGSKCWYTTYLRHPECNK